MKKFLQVSILFSSVVFSTQSTAIMIETEFQAALSVTTCFPTILLTCIGGECGFKELNMPVLEKEALEVLATENDQNISEELTSLIAKIKDLEPSYEKLSSGEVLKREYIKGQLSQEQK